VHGRGCFTQSKRGGESSATIRRTSGQVRSKEVVVDPAVVGGGEDVDPAGVGGVRMSIVRVLARSSNGDLGGSDFRTSEQWMTKTGPQEALRTGGNELQGSPASRDSFADSRLSATCSANRMAPFVAMTNG